MLKTFIEGNRLHVGDRFSVSFQRTLRIPDDGTTYPLPPGLGLFPIHRVEDFPNTATKLMTELGGVFIPMYQREAMWLGFNAAEWKPNAVKVGIGRVNAISGELWDEELHDQPQDYVVCPDQPWLDGINAGAGYTRQFVAMPLGKGYTVEAQITGDEAWGGLQMLVFEPKPGRFPDNAPPKPKFDSLSYLSMPAQAGVSEDQMGLGAGGMMTQKIYPDRYGIDAWDQDNFGSVFVHVLNSEQFHKVTGELPPPTPVDPKTYAERGFPWFKVYDEHEGDVGPSEKLSGVRSISEKENRKDEPLEIRPSQVVHVDPKRKH